MSGTGKTKSTVDATIKGRNPGGNSGSTRQGETPGAGSIHSGVLNQRPNTSNPRNQGPDGSPSEIGNQTLPIITTGNRKTGRIG